MATLAEWPTAAIQDFHPLPPADLQYTNTFIQNNEALVLSTGERYVVGMVDPGRSQLRRQIEAFHRAKGHSQAIEYVKIDKNDLYLFLGKQDRGQASSVNDTAAGLENDGVYLDRIANDAPVVNLVSSLILQAYNEGVSDIHFDAQPDGLVVRFRIDGVLRQVEMIKKDTQMAVSSRIKVMAQLNIMERRLPQDGRCSVQLSGNSYDIRVSVLPTIHGESIVMRLLQKDKEATALGALGFTVDDIARMRGLIGQPHGLLLITGPTGSGKTTSLHALLKELPTEALKIITLEDPVEYQMSGISQVQINESIGLSFEACLRRVLRQDPDVIMVGEIRDHDTAELAIRAGLTGHFVVSSLHTNSAIDAITRLTNLGVEPFLVSAVLRGVIGQRLVRRLCPHCRKEAALEAGDIAFLDQYQMGMRSAWFPVGCEACHGSGYAGRTLVYEVLVPNLQLLRRIETHSSEISVQNCQDLTGFNPMSECALRLVQTAVTSVAEVKRVLYTV